MFDRDAVKNLTRPKGLPFRIGKIGHVVLNVRDVERSVRFYTQVLGFEISDLYPEDDGARRHGVPALQPRPPRHRPGRLADRDKPERRAQPHRLRGRLPRRGDPRPRPPRTPPGARSILPAAGARAARSRSSSATPTTTASKSTGASTRSAATAQGAGSQTNGRACAASRTPSPIRSGPGHRRARSRRCCKR